MWVTGPDPQSFWGTGLHGNTNGTGAQKENNSLVSCSYQLFKLFVLLSQKRNFFLLLVFPFHFTVSSKLSPGKPEHSPAGYAENHVDVVDRETALKFPSDGVANRTFIPRYFI